MSVRLADSVMDQKRVLNALMAISGHVDANKPEVVRAEALVIMREAYEYGRKQIRQSFLDGERDATKTLRHATALIDRLITTLFAFAVEQLPEDEPNRPPMKERISMMAVGGYGRAELFPHSDIDIVFLLGENAMPQASVVIEFILYLLWDLGMRVGHNVVTEVQALELAESDMKARTNLMDARLICGSQTLGRQFQARFWDEIATEETVPDFVEAKMEERNARHEARGDTRYVLEPNIKEGKGGLRDMQTLYWLARYVYRITRTRQLVALKVLSSAEYRAFLKAQRYLTEVRTRMHMIAERAEERLTFDMQRDLAEQMGYRDRGNQKGVERFMKAYFVTAKTVGDLTRVFCAVLEDENKRKRKFPFSDLLLNARKLSGFSVSAGRLSVPQDDFFKEDPVNLLRLFAEAQEHDLDIHPSTLRLVTRQLKLIDKDLRENEEANALFLQMLTSHKQPDLTLRRMSEAGVLGKFIPDFGRVVGQMQYDMYHVYTVDEHTIFAVGLLNQILHGQRAEEFPLATELIKRVESIRVLYLTVFCHDIAKGRGGDHSILGEKVVTKLAKRLGFDAAETETAAWLVRYHLLMSRTAFKRDITEEKTIEDFVEKVQSPERLKLLLILTAVDVRAVGPQVWTEWKGALLRDLYARAEVAMGAADAPPNRAEYVMANLGKELSDWSKAEIEDYLALGYEQFFAGLDMPTHVRIARLIKAMAADENPYAIDISVNEKRSYSDLLVVTQDRKSLFAQIAGAISQVRGNIIGAKVFTLKNGLAVENLLVQNLHGKTLERKDKWDNFEENLGSWIAQKTEKTTIDLPEKRQTRFDVFQVPPRVIIENHVSSHHTVIEVNGRDKLGFLYTIVRALAELELSISTAHISSYGERAVDVFYVKDKFGMKIVSQGKLKQVRDHLTKTLIQFGSTS